jgi:hypothetical protein
MPVCLTDLLKKDDKRIFTATAPSKSWSFWRTNAW